MSMIELWMNPNLSIEERFEIARGEIARLNGVVAKLSADAPRPVVGPIRVGSKIVIGPEPKKDPERTYTYDYAVRELFASGEPKEVVSTDIDENGEPVYNIQILNWTYGIYLDWIKSVE